MAPVITQQVRQCTANSVVNVFLIPVDIYSAELSNYIKECSLEDMFNWRQILYALVVFSFHFTFCDTESSEITSALACQYEIRFSVPAFKDDIDVLCSNLAAS